MESWSTHEIFEPQEIFLEVVDLYPELSALVASAELQHDVTMRINMLTKS